MWLWVGLELVVIPCLSVWITPDHHAYISKGFLNHGGFPFITYDTSMTVVIYVNSDFSRLYMTSKGDCFLLVWEHLLILLHFLLRMGELSVGTGLHGDWAFGSQHSSGDPRDWNRRIHITLWKSFPLRCWRKGISRGKKIKSQSSDPFLCVAVDESHYSLN